MSGRLLTTSSPRPSPYQVPPRAFAQVAGKTPPPQTPPGPRSPALSTTSTADAGHSPVLPSLPVPQLPEHVVALLRTPPTASEVGAADNDEENHFVTTSWGSPYPRSDTAHLHLSSSLDSERFEGSPIHRLQIETPFLRAVPFNPGTSNLIEGSADGADNGDEYSWRYQEPLVSPFSLGQPSSSLVSAAVLVNRARRPTRGLTEDWIRQHTTGDIGSEARLWLSDSSAGGSENSSLSGSVSGGDPAWPDTFDQVQDEESLHTPRAVPSNNGRRQLLYRTADSDNRNRIYRKRHPSSIETLRESDINRLNQRPSVSSSSFIMDPSIESNEANVANGVAKDVVAEDAELSTVPMRTPSTPEMRKSSVFVVPEAVPLPSPETPPSRASPNSKTSKDNASSFASGTMVEHPTLPVSPTKVSKKERATPRRSKKKLPWKGKSILVLLPLDEDRGKPGKAPKPLSQAAVSNMLQSWESLGYNIKGFDLDRSSIPTIDSDGELLTHSMSRTSWPNEKDVARERGQRQYPVLLPDLNAWKNYVDELNERTLRALGVSFADEEPPLPPPPSISPGVGASISRQSSATMYPALPFSPPIPPSSASSSHAGPPFSFPAAFVPGASAIASSSSSHSPIIPAVTSPIPFGMNAKYARQSISIPAGAFQMPPQQQAAPGGYSPQAVLLQQGLARGGSPSLVALSSVMSPISPFSPDGFSAPPMHQRHQSLQYPMMPFQQLQASVRASPRLQELAEVDEDSLSKSPSKTPELLATASGVATVGAESSASTGPFIQHNASLSLQKEIDDAEYHLEEQFRSQFEHDRAYSPHGGRGSVEGNKTITTHHSRDLSVQFAPPPIQRFRDDTENGLPLHHPRPHSRGHSLANAYFVDPDGIHDHADGNAFTKSGMPSAVVHETQKGGPGDDSLEIQTNPSNLGTPVQGLEFSTILPPQNRQMQAHQRAFSTASNPWSDNGSFQGKQGAARRSSHGSKASLSQLNVKAPEFKFNPASTAAFTPSFGDQFFFGNNASESFQPSIFQAGLAGNASLSANSSQLSLPTATTAMSKININAPTFSPGQSEFSFSASGPKFRPDAPAFTPLHSFSNSLTSPMQSGSESITGGKMSGSIFGNIDLNIPDVVKPSKRSKAVPIVRPSSHQSSKPTSDTKDLEEAQYDQEGRIIDESRVKRARAFANDDDEDEVRFAELSPNYIPASSPPPDDVAQAALETAKTEDLLEAKEAPDNLDPLAMAGYDVPLDAVAEPVVANEETLMTGNPAAFEAEKLDLEDENENVLAGEDTTFSSTIVSESTDAKPAEATSPSEVSPLQASVPWAPFEFNTESEVADFNSARPMGDTFFGHKKSLSAVAKPFTPGASFRSSVADSRAADSLTAEDLLPTVEPTETEGQPEMPEVSTALPAEKPLPAHNLDATQPFSFPPPVPSPKPRGLAASRFAMTSPSPPPASPPPKASGLLASRYASSPPITSQDDRTQSEEVPLPDQQQVSTNHDSQEADNLDEVKTLKRLPSRTLANNDHEPTFEEIDDIMRHLNEYDPAQGVHKTSDLAAWNQTLPVVTKPEMHKGAASEPLPDHSVLTPTDLYHPIPEQAHLPLQTTELENPFVDPFPHREASGGSMPPSEWERDFTDEEQLKLESRVNFFDGHVNEVVSSILGARLGPLESSLDRIQHVLASIARGTPSSRRDRRSMTGEIQESDADDEDDELPAPVSRRSMSPRKDRRLDHIRTVVLDALAQHRQNAGLSLVDDTASATAQSAPTRFSEESVAVIMKSLEEVKEQFGQSLRLDFRGEDLRNIVEDAVERRMPLTPKRVETTEQNFGEQSKDEEMDGLRGRIVELEERLRVEETKTETEISVRRISEDQQSELRRKLELAETKIEVEIMNRSAYDQRVADLEDRLKQQEERTESELEMRRAAEDRLAEVQRLLRIASEEEMRLREELDERDVKVKVAEDLAAESKVRLAVLEAAQANGENAHSDMQNRLNAMEAELREKAQEARHWRAEAERTIDLSQRQGEDLVQTTTELRHLKKVVDTLGTQLEENERLRDAWRNKFVALQDDMARAAREVAEETARHVKQEQTLLARHEVLDARLQAEARTRERFEKELERLEGGERQAMRAVAECKRLEDILGEVRAENDRLQRSSMRHLAEFEEARESAAREVQRTRDTMQAEVDQANHQVNVVRGELEDQMSRVRGQLDQVRLDADTARARLEMLLEEAESTKRTALEQAEATKRSALEEAEQRRQNEVEDMQARYERQLNNNAEDAQRSEQNLLERLSISTSRTEHLQDRVAHLEEKLDIAREAAQAAAKAAKAVGAPVEVDSGALMTATAAATPAKAVLPSGSGLQPAASVIMRPGHGLGLPEKISPQALRESILVLQEQLQQREQRIEELEHRLSEVDPEADIKIAKRDDEILWLRELLAVRHSDLQDIITALGRNDHDPERVRDAVIRLKANLQMEEQERERAVNGASAVKLPTLAESLRDAATPRVAQAVGPLAAAWGNWRRARDSNAGGTFSSLSGVLSAASSPAAAVVAQARASATLGSAAATPSRESLSSSSAHNREISSARSAGRNNSFLTGLLTPPTSGMRQTPTTRASEQLQLQQELAGDGQSQQAKQQQQPTAFTTTGRRYTGEQLAGRRISQPDKNKFDGRDTTPPPALNFGRPTAHSQPRTPPMVRTTGYDSDAHAEDFDDAAFFDD